jgi:hypothetical protein
MRLQFICSASQQSSDWDPKSAIRYPRSPMLMLPCPAPPVAQEAAAKPDDSRLLLDCALALHRLAAGGAFPQGHWVLSPWLCGARQLCLRWHAFCGRLRRCPAVAHGILCQAPARIFHGWLFIWRDWIWICLILRPQICYPLPLP